MAAPMKLKQAELSNVGLVKDLVTSDDWTVEQKMDGIRILFEIAPSSVKAWNSSGGAMASSTALKNMAPIVAILNKYAAMLATGTKTLWLDGELIPATKEFWAFDSEIDFGLTYENRRDRLRDLVKSICSNVADANKTLKILPVYGDSLDKIQLINRVLASGAEGVVFKHKRKPYEQGRRADHQLKAKAWRSVDVIAGTPGATGKNSVELFVNDDHGTPVPVGAATLNGREHLGIKTGDVLEVKYLYATATHQLYGPPDIMRVRDDKPIWECRFDQFVYTDRSVIEL